MGTTGTSLTSPDSPDNSLNVDLLRTARFIRMASNDKPLNRKELRKAFEEWQTGALWNLPSRGRDVLPNAGLHPSHHQAVKRRISQLSASVPPDNRIRDGIPVQFGNKEIQAPKFRTLPEINQYSTLAANLECICKIGQGSYGYVYKCRNKMTGELVAVKKFIENENHPHIRKIALREIRMIKRCRHPNIVLLLDVFKKRHKLYLVFEFCNSTLLEEIHRADNGLEEPLARSFIRDILQALRFLHEIIRCIHRDIKPENILIGPDGLAKVCDFGFARTISVACVDRRDYTDYVATRWYRAPELLTSRKPYGTGIDIWAVGCVFYECLTGQPIFPGSSDIDQLSIIRKGLSRDPQEWLTSKLPSASYAAVKLIRGMLELDPAHRPPAANLLALQYFAYARSPSISFNTLSDIQNQNVGKKSSPMEKPDAYPKHVAEKDRSDSSDENSVASRSRRSHDSARPVLHKPPTEWQNLRSGIDYRKQLAKLNTLPKIV